MNFRWLTRLARASPATGRLIRQASGHRLRAAAYLVLLLASAGLGSLKFLLLKQLVHAGINADADAGTGLWLGATTACWLGEQLLVYFAAVLGMRFERLVASEIVEQRLADLLERSARDVCQVDANQAAHLLRRGFTTIMRSLRSSLTAVSQATLLCGYIATAFLLDPVLAAICLLTGLATMAWTARHIAKQRQGTNESLAGERQIYLQICRMLETLPLVQVYQAGEKLQRRIADYFGRQRRGQQLALRGQRLSTLEASLVAAVTGLVLLLAGSVRVHQGNGSLADLTVLLVLHQLIFSRMRLVLGFWAGAEENSGLLDDVLVATPIEPSPERGSKPLSAPIESIVCDDVRLDAGNSVLLDEVTCQLVRGRLYGVCGPSGAGKTMFLHLLSGQVKVHSGRLVYNGVEQPELDREDLSRRIGQVAWPPMVVRDTLAANLRLAAPEANDEQLQSVLADVGFDSDLRHLEAVGGLQTPLGQGGVQLSIGQVQRVAIARALLRAPDILLIDDVLSGLDPISTGCVLRSLRQLAARRLVVLVSSKWDVLKCCDQVLQIDGGRLVRQAAPARTDIDPSWQWPPSRNRVA